MAANTELDPGAGGDTIRDIDRTGVKTPIVGIDLTPGGGSETLMNGVMPVSDNGGSLTVDGTVTATTGLTTADLDLAAGTDTRAVVGIVYANAGGAVNVTNTTGLPVAAQGTFPVQIGTGGIAKAEDAVAASGDSGIPLLAVRNDAAATKTSADGDYSTLATDDAGRLGISDLGGSISIDDNAGSLTVDNAGTFAVQIAANSSVNNAQVSGTAVSVNSGTKDAGTQRVILASDQTVVPISDNAGSLTVDNAGTFAVQIAANSSVNVAQMAGTTTDTNSGVKSAGTQRVVLATDQPALTNALKVDGSAVTQPVSATNLSTNVAQVAGTATAVNSGNKDAGTQRVVIATDQVQLTNALKVDGSATTQPVSGNVSLAAAAGATGLSKSHLVSAASTNATNVKASAGKLHGWYIYNSNAAARKVAFHNTAGTPTAGSGVTDSIVIPPTSAANAFTDIGIAFSTGIAFTTVTDLTDAGATAVGASDLVINLYFV